MEYNWSELSPYKTDRWLQLCPLDSYRVVAPFKISGLLSDSLVKKYDSVLLICSGVQDTNTIIFMANGLRVDAKDSAVDQMPFGFGYIPGSGSTSGLLIQHGSWEQRTSKPPPDFWRYIQQSGIGKCFPLSVIPKQQSGHISELQVSSQTTGAFANLIAGLEMQFSEFTA